MVRQSKAEELRRLIDLPRFQLEQYPKEDALAAIQGDEFTRYSTQEFIDKVDEVSAALWGAGYRKDDKICIISHNRPEWNFLDLGMQQIGVVNVPAYPRLGPEEYKYIFNDAEVKAVFVSDKELYDEVESIRKDTPSVKKVYSFDDVEGAICWTEIFKEKDKADPRELQEVRDSIGENDLATIVYTSGTTGKPKGVMLSHRNLISNLKACMPILPVDERHRSLSFLPLNHVFERMMSYFCMACGISIYYAESVDTIGKNMRQVKPQVFTTVPRLLEKVYERIVKEGLKLSGVKRLIFHWAHRLAKDYELTGKSFWYRWQHALADRLVYSKWREALGGEVRCIVAGGAAVHPKLGRVFTAAGIVVLEGYGMTEASPVISANRMDVKDRQFGTVGRVLENEEVKIGEDGEILAKGPNVMMGYYNMPEETEKTLEKEGWLHTGDIGHFDENGLLVITDRKKSLFKTSGGKYVAPQHVESELNESYLIEHSLAVGEGRKMVTALILPDFKNLKEWCAENDIAWTSREEIINNEQVRQKLEEEIEKHNQPLSHTEKVKKFRLVADPWSPESGELTPTLKPKRAIIQKKYEALIEEMYEVEA